MAELDALIPLSGNRTNPIGTVLGALSARDAAAQKKELGSLQIENIRSQIDTRRAEESRAVATEQREIESAAYQEGIERATTNARILKGLILQGNIPDAISFINQNDTGAGEQEFIRQFLDPANPDKAKKAIPFLDQAIGQAGKAPEEFTLTPGDVRFRGQEEIASVPATPEPTLKPPVELVQGLPAGQRGRAIEAFNLAGGGKAGVDALQAQVQLDSTAATKNEIPQILNATFPDASPTERAELDAVMAAAKTVESGLKQADSVRVRQRKDKEGRRVQVQALTLLNNLLSNKEIKHVLGPLEATTEVGVFGGVSLGLSDKEAAAIADIQQLESILTVPNLQLMSGTLSETDIQLLIKLSAGALDRRSEGRFLRDVPKLRDVLSKNLINSRGWPIKQDANGNFAFVGPNGEVEEI